MTRPLIAVDRPEDLGPVLGAITEAGGKSRAFGVWVEPVGPTPRYLAEDYRRSRAGSLGLCSENEADPVWVFDLHRLGPVDRLLDVLASFDSYLVFHDAHAALYRLSHLTDRSFEPARIGCTRIAGALLSEGTRRGRDLAELDELCKKVLNRPAPAPVLEDAMPAAEIVAARAAILLPLMQGLTPMLRRRELVPSHRLECQILPAVVDMERAGFGVDGAAFQRVAEQWRAERTQTRDPDRITRLDKLLSTYAYWPQEFIRGDRIHCRLHPLAADSGRFSCTEPNLQQVPSEHTAPGLRGCFVAAPGHVLVIADYAQIELRVAAHLAPCDALRQVFAQDRDPHRATAATLTGKAERDVTDHERKLAKAVNFGFLFGMGAPRFRSYAASSYGLDLDQARAQRARAAFLRTYPGIAAWHRRVGSMGRDGQAVTVRTALGRRKRFEPGRFSFNAALNIPVQGTAAEGFKLAMAHLLPRLRELGGRGVLCVHDEYIAEVPEDRAEEASEIVIEVMRDQMATLVDTVPIEVEARIAASWG